ncbi:hypothetical protein ACKGJO_04915 [Gracilimonas sp. Q87]|uniref:hypothetical protein n=1 Tax=Gracilimonas sp. Q87 TaxID=3384766 RepID=UPI003983DEB8
MKTIKFSVILVLMYSFMASTAEAQIWKKIKDKTKSKVEEKVSDKISEQLANAVVEKIDIQFNSPNNPYGNSVRSEKPENLPESYSFDWRFKMKITNAGMQDELLFDYYLTSNGNYVGYEMPEADGVFMVMDGNLKSTISYVEEEGNSIALTYSMPDEMTGTEDSEMEKEDLVITDLPSKTILGYNTQGKKIESDESTIIMYYTDEIDMNFSGMFPSFSNNEKTPDYNYPQDMREASVLYMEVTENESGDKFIMEGIGIDETDRVITNGDYQFL